jgi:uncharacterized protein with PIN domain
VIVLDAYALVALLADEPAAEEVAGLIAGSAAAVPAPNLAEAADRLARVHGIPVARTRATVELLEGSGDVRVVALGPDQAWRAAELRTTYYHRTRCPLSLGDCLLIASVAGADQLVTSDGYVLQTAAHEGIAWTALPDSQGARHDPV